MIFQAESYSKGDYTAPNRDDRKLDKDTASYHRQFAQYAYKLFCSGSTLISHDYYSSIARNRKYSRGSQDEDIYKDMFYGKENNNTLGDIYGQNGTRESRRKAMGNLNFTIQSPAPVVVDSIVNKLMKLVNRVSVDSTDEYSNAQRESLKYGAYVDGKFKKEFETLRMLMGLPQQEQGYAPKSVEELNLYEAEGGFKLVYEETMETLLKYVFERSYWEEHVLEKVLKDLIDVGFAAVMDDYDKHTGQVKAKYVDAEYAGVQYTNEDGNYDPDFGFFVRKVKMSELHKKGIKEPKLLELAKTYQEKFGNPKLDDNNKGNKVSGSEYTSSIDDFTVPVFVVYWKDVEHDIRKQYNNRRGEIRTKQVDSDYQFKAGEKEVYTRIMQVRQVHWCIGSDVVYDWGVSEFQARDGNKEPKIPIHMVQFPNKPLMDRIIPSLDQFMQGWMKLQQGLSMAFMDGYAIDMDTLSNMKMNGEKLSPLDVLKLHRQTGVLFYKTTDVAGRPHGTQTVPITRIQGGAGAVMQDALNLMDLSMSQIEKMTGVTPISMGAQPSPEQGKAVTEFSLMGTNTVLDGILKRANILKSDVARNICLRLAHVVQSDKRAYDTYKNIVGETRLETLKIARGHDVTYGIRTHARPTDAEVQDMREMLANALKNGRDGKARITEGDYFRFLNMLMAGESLKRIALLLTYAQDKEQAKEEQKAAAAAQQNIQGAQQTEAMKAQNEAQLEAQKTQGKIQEEKIKGLNSILLKAIENKEMTAQQALAMMGIGGQPQPMQAAQPQQEMVEREQREIPAGAEGV